MMYDLQHFGMRDMVDAGRRLRNLHSGHRSMEEAACNVVDFFYNQFRAQGSLDGSTNCVLARCFKTHPFESLTPHLQRQATAAAKQPLHPNTQCLTLLATRGERPRWNSRFTSAGHQAIPLISVEEVARAPMVAQLLLQLGLEIHQVVRSLPHSTPQQSFGVFHIPSALGSPSVPQQTEFVEPFGVQSVLGFGGLLPAGELFAVILFTRVTISPETANLFRTLALGVKLTLLPFSGKQVFTEH